VNTADYLQHNLTMIRPMAVQKGTTERGNWYTLSQNAPHIIQLTLQNGNYVITETLESIRSEQEMIERRNMLENEFIEWVNSKTSPQENNNEATS
jgi:N-formylglutamate amidohydrolase